MFLIIKTDLPHGSFASNRMNILSMSIQIYSLVSSFTGGNHKLHKRKHCYGKISIIRHCVKHGMEWIGLEWNGTDLSGAHFYFEIYFRNNPSPNHSNGRTGRFNIAVCIRYIHVCNCVICIFSYC